MYRLLLDCTPGDESGNVIVNSGATSFDGFISIKFEIGSDLDTAISRAISRTVSQMKDKGFSDSEIASFNFALEEFAVVDPSDVDLDSERAFAYY
jgi:hypothetical protein